jgi:1-acyl-sn-glycerol-3-phosphate acyltransferase
MTHTYHVPLINRIFRVIILKTFRLIFDLFCRVETTGLDKVPVGKSYLMVFNHVSLYEAPVLLSYWPEKPEVLGAVDVWNRPGQDLLAKAYGGIPIHRGEVDRSAMNKMLEVLEAGLAIAVAPEGGRSHTPGMRRGKPGISFLLEKFRIPIIPVGIVGTTEDLLSNMIRLKKPRIQLNIGDSFFLPDGLGDDLPRSKAYQLRVDYVMRKITELLPDEYRGYYR